ncbi:hypothetical protein AUJ73_02410 [Candidatus Gottesmanbacteria bacterium CG1_02_37_22]|nr:MAG: hypothetical protein AUJ73_02410 [Candidatus Gottesmanbacteria bacterium CG1_02_37_22]
MISVTGAFIMKKGKFLLAKRSRGELKGLWEFPGGKIEKDETPFQAIVREVKEELDFKVTPKKIIGKYSHNYPFGKVTLHLVECETEIDPWQISIQGSHSKIAWVGPNEISKLNLAPLDRKIINRINSSKIIKHMVSYFVSFKNKKT